MTRYSIEADGEELNAKDSLAVAILWATNNVVVPWEIRDTHTDNVLARSRVTKKRKRKP
jgi:hypothetical protein